MATPVNGETFLPQLLADYLEDQRSAMGLPAALTIAPWPYLGEFTRPQLSIEASQFRFDAHPATATYDVTITLDYGVDGDPPRSETAAQRLTRLQAQLTAETTIVSKLRAVLSLRAGQTITYTSSVQSLFSWITDTRSTPAGEDGWGLEEFIIAAGGGNLVYLGDKRERLRVTQYTARLMTNEFTV